MSNPIEEKINTILKNLEKKNSCYYFKGKHPNSRFEFFISTPHFQPDPNTLNNFLNTILNSIPYPKYSTQDFQQNNNILHFGRATLNITQQPNQKIIQLEKQNQPTNIWLGFYPHFQIAADAALKAKHIYEIELSQLNQYAPIPRIVQFPKTSTLTR